MYVVSALRRTSRSPAKGTMFYAELETLLGAEGYYSGTPCPNPPASRLPNVTWAM
jgi:hypothetical protein